MHGNSRPVRSAQRGPHDDLRARVLTHLASPWRRPIAFHTRAAFEVAAARAAAHAGPVQLDAGCGNGTSTLQIAANAPQALVIGVDKSSARLGGSPPDAARARRGPIDDGLPELRPTNRDHGGNMLLLRADLRDFWRLALAADWRPARQVLLYPNPWPKPAQLARRWHAHPVFPFLVALGGTLELRSNWLAYVEEFAAALEVCEVPAQIAPLAMHDTAGSIVSPFERKYLASGQTCWRLCAELGDAGLPGGRAALVASMSGL